MANLKVWYQPLIGQISEITWPFQGPTHVIWLIHRQGSLFGLSDLSELKNVEWPYGLCTSYNVQDIGTMHWFPRFLCTPYVPKCLRQSENEILNQHTDHRHESIIETSLFETRRLKNKPRLHTRACVDPPLFHNFVLWLSPPVLPKSPKDVWITIWFGYCPSEVYLCSDCTRLNRVRNPQLISS